MAQWVCCKNAAVKQSKKDRLIGEVNTVSTILFTRIADARSRLRNSSYIDIGFEWIKILNIEIWKAIINGRFFASWEAFKFKHLSKYIVSHSC
mmetsp:Transcript_26990/g.41856  ORF Transcript_26990/g.41856 Transcript_26990/m.41856 type:complete len:93 (+) Transcript_26990:3516-3794(+)